MLKLGGFGQFEKLSIFKKRKKNRKFVTADIKTFEKITSVNVN